MSQLPLYSDPSLSHVGNQIDRCNSPVSHCADKAVMRTESAGKASHATVAGKLNKGFFSILDARSRTEFSRLSNRVNLRSGETIFLQETEHSSTFIIESGLIRTYYVSKEGREVTLGYWSEGDVVGGPCMFGGTQHVWSAAANRRSVVYAISGPNLKKLSSSDARVMSWLFSALEFKLRWLSVLFQIHGTEHVRERLAKLLLMMGDLYGEESGGDILIKYRISQSDLASLLGASRQWTNKALAKLRDDGVIVMDERRILLRDPKVLRNILKKS